jgi:hypothetical protein
MKGIIAVLEFIASFKVGNFLIMIQKDACGLRGRIENDNQTKKGG